jgi:hypothetical protein
MKKLFVLLINKVMQISCQTMKKLKVFPTHLVYINDYNNILSKLFGRRYIFPLFLFFKPIKNSNI